MKLDPPPLLPHIIYKNELKKIKDLNVRINPWEHLEENKDNSLGLWIWWSWFVSFFLSFFFFFGRGFFFAVAVVQSCLTPCDPVDCSPPGSSVCGIFLARILEWVVISFYRGSSWPRDRTYNLLQWQVGSLPLSHQGNPSGFLDDA